MSLLQTAQKYQRAGLCALPADKHQKRPTVGAWKIYQTRKPTDEELQTWFDQPDQDGICIITGQASNNVEMIDFDQHAIAYADWLASMPAEMAGQLVVESTQSGGKHVVYRCDEPVEGNLKLAQRVNTETGEQQTLIETRGEGGLFLCAPTPGYAIEHGDLCDLPTITAQQRDTLLNAARALTEIEIAPPQPPKPIDFSLAPQADYGRPGDDYNTRGDIRDTLIGAGWTYIRSATNGDKQNEFWRRPGKTDGNHSATFDGTTFYVFSSNAAPFEPNQGYSKFAVFATLAHGGSFERATQALAGQGYDSTPQIDMQGVDLTDLLTSTSSATEAKAETLPVVATRAELAPMTLKEMRSQFTGLNTPIIHGMLREGETMNIVAAPKSHKSWLAMNLAISMAAGLAWMGHEVEFGKVLHIDNELHASTLTHRYMTVETGMQIPAYLYEHHVETMALRGRLKDVVQLSQMFDKIEHDEFKVIIIDAFYRALPAGTDENDNRAIAGVYNLIDQYAERLGCAFILIHHTSKGSQSGKGITDVGAGAGSQSRAVDCHLVIREHEEPGIFVLESVTRSFPPADPIAVKWEFPLFVPVDNVDVTALAGTKPKKAPEPSLNDWVDMRIKPFEPVSKKLAVNAALEAGESKRKAEDKLQAAVDAGIIAKIKCGAKMRYVMNRPQVNGDAGLWAAAILARNPNADIADVAAKVDCSARRVRQIKADMEREDDGNIRELWDNCEL